MLSRLDEDRIEAAVTAAEDGTSGEILCALAAEVSQYREVPLAWGAGVALALPPLALTLGVNPLDLASRAGAWLPGQVSAMAGQIDLALALYALVQLGLFVVTALIVHIPAVRRHLTPASLKRRRVARAAQHQFATMSARATGSDTGILIFVAVDDRQVQILADANIHQKIEDDAWNRAAKAIGAEMKAGHDPTGGIVQAIEICGQALKLHFPSDAPHPHSFRARPVEV